MGKKKAKIAILDASVRILVLVGPEPMRKTEMFDKLKRALEKAHGEVGLFKFDGKTAVLSDVLDELRTFGLLQPYKLVVVDDAKEFVSTHRDAIERYAKNPVDHATLVLRGVNWNSPKLDKLIAKVGAKIKCEPPSSADAKKWVIGRAESHHECKIQTQAAEMLVDRIGCDMLRLDSELAKLAVLSGSEPIGTDLIAQVAGRASDEKAWVVQEAVLQSIQMTGRSRTASDSTGGGVAIEKLHELIELSGQPEVLVCYFVGDLFRKLYLAVQMKRQGMGPGQIGRELKIWPRERQTLFMGFLDCLNEAQISKLFDDIVEMDQRSKSGYGNAMRNLERFCAALGEAV